jgi:methyltransferase
VTAAGSPAPVALLAFFIVLLVLERLLELVLSARHAPVLMGRGAVERGRRHFPWLVALHALFPVLLLWEVLRWGARPGPFWWAWLALFVMAQVLRYASVRALGVHWNVRILVIPGAPRIRHGPYRLLPHPNYLAVAIELLSGPMMFGAWRTALVISALNLVALSVRIRAERRALAWAEAAKAAS